MISNFFNWLLTLIAGRTSRGDQRLFLIAFMRGKFEGQWTLQWATERKRGQVFRLEWTLFRNLCSFDLSRSGEGNYLTLHAAVPGISFWLSGPIRLRLDGWAKWNEKYGGYPGSHAYNTFKFFEVRFFDNAIWWSFLKFDWGWSSKMPKWMDGNFHPIDFLFGRMKCETEILGTFEVVIPMPEGSYPATVKLEERTWKRPRLPWKDTVRKSADVRMKEGIPHEGKGENSWDCGKDALFGINTKAETIEEAIAETVKAVLKSRRRYDGNAMAMYPPPPGKKVVDENQLVFSFETAAENAKPA